MACYEQSIANGELSMNDCLSVEMKNSKCKRKKRRFLTYEIRFELKGSKEKIDVLVSGICNANQLYLRRTLVQLQCY